VTFNPHSPATLHTIALDSTGGGFSGVACPRTSQCTATDYDGRELTFNPNSPPAPPHPIKLVSPTDGLAGVACVSVSQCTAVDFNKSEVTFNPLSPPKVGRPHLIDSNDNLTNVACPAIHRCVASDYSGATVTFNPASPGSPRLAPIPFAGALLGLACPSAAECVVTDQLGFGFVGYSAPVDRAGPTISGTPRQGSLLTEHHGTWAGVPTRFSYQWLDCDKTGAKCSVIGGANGRSYKLKSSDVGHTIRVRESAANSTGRSGWATSVHTAAVNAKPKAAK
jgi:hypothetical protein